MTSRIEGQAEATSYKMHRDSAVYVSACPYYLLPLDGTLLILPLKSQLYNGKESVLGNYTGGQGAILPHSFIIASVTVYRQPKNAGVLL